MIRRASRRARLSFRFIAACVVSAGLCPIQADAQSSVESIAVGSPALVAGEGMPREFTPDGRNLSPPLTWSGLPEQTREIAVVCADFAAGNPPPWVHWVVYGISGTARGLPVGLPIEEAEPMPAGLEGAIQGLNSWRRPFYRGPAPPAGRPHLYHFTVYALDRPLGLGPGLDREELLEAMAGHVIGKGEMVVVYERFASVR